MRRREFVALVGVLATWPVAAPAQESTRTWRVGQVLGGTPETLGHLARTLEHRLAELGYVQGKNLLLITRFAMPQAKAFEEAILSLLPHIDFLVVWSTVGRVAARKLALSVPVVFASVGAPVDIGLVESLARPGGNMTGITFEAASETYGRRLQILKEIMPNLERVAVLRASGDANVRFAMESLDQAAPMLGVTLTWFDIKSGDDLPATIPDMQRRGSEALLVVAGALTYVNGKKIADLALAHHLPSCHAFKETVAEGGLVSLGPDLLAIGGQAASYVDKILRGAKPADLPVQQPARYEVHLNLKTAKSLDITIPPTLLARADEVIE
jgi:putative ABC transport system substrate-binding protein